MSFLQLHVLSAVDVESRIPGIHVPQSPAKNSWTTAATRCCQDPQRRCFFVVQDVKVSVRVWVTTEASMLQSCRRSLQRERVSCGETDSRHRQWRAEELSALSGNPGTGFSYRLFPDQH